MIGTVTRVAGAKVFVRMKEFPGRELPARAVVQRLSVTPETWATYKAGDKVLILDDEEGGLLVTGVIR